MPATDHRMNLNDLMQKNRWQDRFNWEFQKDGPSSGVTWTARAIFDGVECGTGSASSKDAAKEIAAEQALRALMGRGN